MLKFKSASIAGPKDLNQDAILEPFSVSGRTLCAIADGVGSSKFGGAAAHAAIQAVQKSTAEDQMETIFQNARLAVIRKAEEIAVNGSMSTTLTVLSIQGSNAIVGHVGDTRVTHIRNNGVTSRTKDQTEVQRLLDDGVITKNQAARYPRKNVLLSAISIKKNYELYESSFYIQAKDRIILTTDGFHTKILRREIMDTSINYPYFDDFWKNLMIKISQTTLDDDASCIAIEI